MKKRLLFLVLALLLSACADKNQYEQAVLAQMQKEQDIKDYKITPEYMAKCVVDTTVKNMPGVFPFDPNRLMAYRNYTKMLNLTAGKPEEAKNTDLKKALDELRNDFGSPQALSEAHNNYTESLVECYSAMISESEEAVKDKK
jgi:hypothetical protein